MFVHVRPLLSTRSPGRAPQPQTPSPKPYPQPETLNPGRYQVLQVRLAFDAVVQVSDMAERPIWRARGLKGLGLRAKGQGFRV